MERELSAEVKQLMRAVGLINECLTKMLEIDTEVAFPGSNRSQAHKLAKRLRSVGPLAELEQLLGNWPELDDDSMGRQF